MKRRLPVLVEQAVGAVQAEAAEKGMAFERLIRKERQPTCQPSCDHCCYHPLEISLFEAIPLYRYLVQRGRWTPSFVKTLQQHAEQVQFQMASVWLLTRIPCPLLVDHRCSAYEARPLACRSTWATGDPYYCHGQRFGDQTSLVAKADLMGAFQAQERLLAKQVGLTYYTMPVSRALLYAAKVVNGELSITDLRASLGDDFRKRG